MPHGAGFWDDFWGKPIEQWLLNPCWLMIIGDSTTLHILGIIMLQQGNLYKPTRIKWNDRGILNTAQFLNAWWNMMKYGEMLTANWAIYIVQYRIPIGVTVAQLLGRWAQPCPVVDLSKRSYERGTLAVRAKSRFQYIQASNFFCQFRFVLILYVFHILSVLRMLIPTCSNPFMPFNALSTFFFQVSSSSRTRNQGQLVGLRQPF